MTRSQRGRDKLRARQDAALDRDEIDPRDFFEVSSRDRKENRKAKQLCRQVAETLEMVLSGESHDELLQALHVVGVEPAPDSSRLLVTVQTSLPDEEANPAEILEQLNTQAGRLRSEVAGSIHRKRAPTPLFRVANAPAREEAP